MSSRQVVYAQKRRSSRIDKAMPVFVQGVGAFRAPFQEQVTTQSISCHGCTFVSKHEVIQGDVVFLDLQHPAEGEISCSSRAQVKWIQRLSAKEHLFKVAVELELPGNIWGVSTPPEDWFPVHATKATEPAQSGRDLKVVRRTDLTPAAVPERGIASTAPAATAETPGSLSPSLAQVLVGLGEQIQAMASDAAASALVREKGRLLAEFRAELQEEATRTLELAVADAKQDLTRRTLQELNEAHEAAVRATYERWNKKIEQDMAASAQRLANHGKTVSERMGTAAAGTLARMEREMDTSRSQAVDRLVTRLRERMTPLLEEAQKAVQKLAESEVVFKEQSQALCARYQAEFERSLKDTLAKSSQEQDQCVSAHLEESAKTLLKLSQDCEKAAQEHLRSLIVSAADYTRKAFEQRSAEVSRQFSSRLESMTRNYLESISESIAAIPKKTALQPNE